MMEVIDCEQGTPEWFDARLGIPTASMFSTVMAKGRGGGESKTRRTYMLKLAGEIITKKPMDSFTNSHMERGHEMEPEARNMYSFMHDVEPTEVGFIRNGLKGASPDSLIDGNGLLEIKTKLAHLQIDLLLKDEVPPEHMAQIQGQIWVSEREWCDFVSYWPDLPLFVKRVYRDDEFINGMASQVLDFNEELAELVSEVNGRF